MDASDKLIIPKTDCVAGLGCGSQVDIDGDGNTDSQQDFFEHQYPCNSIHATYLTKLDSPIGGHTPTGD